VTVRADRPLKASSFDAARDRNSGVLASDLSEAATNAPLARDHVLGIGGASTTLASWTPRPAVATALDLGTGCGVQSLHLATHADSVTATDLSARALAFARFNAALNGSTWELLEGSLLEPVAGRRFDLVVSNPPFVAGPGTTAHTYRDSGRPGDAVCAELVAAAPGLPAVGEQPGRGGHMQFLANWLHVAGEDWADRVADWVAGTGLASYWISPAAAEGFFHSFSGWLMFVVALVGLLAVHRAIEFARSRALRVARTA